MLPIHEKPENQEVYHDLLSQKKIRLFVKREDKIHPQVSGNKWRKLKYNLVAAREQGFDTLLTFGGAYSNHIYATAAAANEAGFNSIGIIRGDELKSKPLNKTLTFAKANGMVLEFVSRHDYRNKNTLYFTEWLKKKFGPTYLLPEGGTNIHAVKGCEEIITNEDRDFDVVCSAVGTGGTLAGVISGMRGEGRVIGFSALKGKFLTDDVNLLLRSYGTQQYENWEINGDYHFGKYAKVTPELMHFINDFTANCGILLDPVYTGKMMFGIFDLIKKNYFLQGSAILAIHTGGLQGII